MLTASGHSVSSIHGKMEERARDKALKDFHENASKILIATNVLSRGIDVPNVTLVVQYDMPVMHGGMADPETYLHRVGRTGRFGRKGVALNLIEDEKEMRVLNAIEDYYERQAPIQEIPPTTDPEAILALLTVTQDTSLFERAHGLEAQELLADEQFKVMRDLLVTPRMKEIAAFEQHAAALHAAIGGEAVPTSGDLKTERMTFTSARAYAIKVEAALAQKPAAWATWLEAVLDVKLLQGGSSAAARAVCITRMAHVLGADHAALLLELDQFGLSTRDTLRTHLAAQAAGRVAGNAAAAGAAAGDAGKGTSTECH